MYSLVALKKFCDGAIFHNDGSSRLLLGVDMSRSEYDKCINVVDDVLEAIGEDLRGFYIESLTVIAFLEI